MPLRRIYDGKNITTTFHDGYLDRLNRWSDIQEYLPFLFDQACTHPRILELGSRKGNSTLAFLAAAELSGGHVWSGDIADVRLDPRGMARWRNARRWTFIQGDDMDPDVQARFPDEVDLFFLDTSHEYSHTLAELRAYMPRVARNGIALFHDTHLMSWPGYDWTGEKSPVWTALDDYCAETGRTWEDLPGEYGLGIIRG
jgi:cephalosporin hydroxylase